MSLILWGESGISGIDNVSFAFAGAAILLRVLANVVGNPKVGSLFVSTLNADRPLMVYDSCGLVWTESTAGCSGN